ncbi:uncharacterized protein LOC126842096 [Adelges cooleyi]|uniref:uncharacterized protein LOC126842096 n=1 Tax=Adelges cooleyi TaxID=133065 RepID=UPI00217FEB1D|nr:uncharacterized protein LOC126842096 [Adelges cooleyi]
MSVSDYLMKSIEGKKYEIVKNNEHFEWVNDCENTINKLTAEIFDTLGVKDENELNASIKHLDKHQEHVIQSLSNYAKDLENSDIANDNSKKFINDWAEGVKFQISKKYHLIGGPSDKKIRRAFESTMPHFIVCSTTLADMTNNSEYKIAVSNFSKVVILNMITCLQELKLYSTVLQLYIMYIQQNNMANACERLGEYCEGWSYFQAKRVKHFEWIKDYESSIKKLTTEVFDTLGVTDESALNASVKRIEQQQEYLKNSTATYAKKLAVCDLANEAARHFINEWAECTVIQTEEKKYYQLDGLSASKVRWCFEITITYFTICATFLANMNDNSEFKIGVSNFAKDVIQNLIDSLQGLKNDIEALRNKTNE